MKIKQNSNVLHLAILETQMEKSVIVTQSENIKEDKKITFI